MNWKTLVIGSLLTLAVAGCGDNTQPVKPTPPKSQPVPPTVPAAPAVPVAPAATTPAVPRTVVPTATVPAVPAVPTAPAAPTMPAMTMPAMSMPVATAPAATVPASATAAAATVTSKADGLLATASQAIKDKKWDIADGAVTQLNNLKPSLPTEYGPKIDQVKTLLDGAKALTQPTSIPGLRL
jgi:hypothetical protein